PTNGILNRLLTAGGLNFLAQDWLGNIGLVIYSVSMIEVWKWTGLAALIFLAGLQSISKDYYEALAIDGATKWQTFRYVTFPLLRPAFNTNLLISVIGGLRVFDIVYATTGGGPGTASEVISSFVYRKFAYGYFGQSTAIGLLLFILVSLVAVPLYAWTSKKEVEL
ncbi:MAG: carbohydrate ABC transporter permease, partial [Bacteroidota bacterium]